MHWAIGIVYGLHFASIATLLVGGFGMLGQVKGVGGYDVNPNFAKRVLSRRRVIALGMWGVLGTGLLLAAAGLEMGFVAGRLGFPRQLSPGLFASYLVLMILLIASTLHQAPGLFGREGAGPGQDGRPSPGGSHLRDYERRRKDGQAHRAEEICRRT